MDNHEASELFRRDPDRHLDVGAGEAAYRKVGTGPDVLFVHGWPVTGATFRYLLPHLVDHVTCHIIDFPGAGQSRFNADTTLSIAQHVTTIRRVVDLLDLDEVAVVGHDSGGMISRHAMAGDERLRAMGLVNTEPASGVSWRFTSFLSARKLPFVGAGLGWVAGQKAVRRNKFVLGDAFVDRSLLDGEFDEFFLRPLNRDRHRLDGATRLLKSFDMRYVHELEDMHNRIDVPVQLVWGDQDPFFPVENARKDVSTFAQAKLVVVEGAGLFSHEEAPAEVAEALIPVLTDSTLIGSA